MPSLLGPIAGTPYIGGQTPSLLAVDAAGLQTTWKVNLSAVSAPTVTDDSSAGYVVGSKWYYGASIYECTSATVGAAVWTTTTATPAGVGTELQYRVSGSAFGAITGSSWDSTTLTLPPVNISTAGTHLTLTNGANAGTITQDGDRLKIRGTSTGKIDFGLGTSSVIYFEPGKIGLGNNDPTAGLDITGAVLVRAKTIRFGAAYTTYQAQWTYDGSNTYFDYTGGLNLRRGGGSAGATMLCSSTGTVSIGTSGTSGKFTVESTTTQAAFRYDAANYATCTVGATGITTLQAYSGTITPSFVFANPVQFNANAGFGTELVTTPTGTTATLSLTGVNKQTLECGSASGDLTVTFTVPTQTCSGDVIFHQGATARDITFAVSAGSYKWLGTEPTWNADTSKYRIVGWRWNGSILFLSATETD